MKVILNQDVTDLGEEGDIKDVADGFARNYLLPRKLAVPHTKEFLATLGHRRAAIEKRKEEKRLEAASLKERLEAQEIRFAVPAGDNGKLFGSVNNSNVAVELEKKGFTIEKKRIEIPEHTIRSVGTFKVRIRLYDKEEATVKLIVESSGQPGGSGPAKPVRPAKTRAAAAPAKAPVAPAVEAPAAPPETPAPADAQ
ncbi:MAG: 50S ribosomal protein L9 [Spirochaetia bacterium]|jgi:large subunit ribosomal protein L9